MIERKELLGKLRKALSRTHCVVLTGPRQSGKTTLVRELLSPESINYFDLEDPASLARLDEPMTSLEPLQGLVVIDEVQRRPDLFPILRVLLDRRPCPAHFLILGSTSGELLHQTSESLAGRIEQITIGGLNLQELGTSIVQKLWLRGGFPPSYLAIDEENSLLWRANYIQTILERDLAQWGVRVPATTLRRFWMILAHYHGQTWNAAECARALGVSGNAARRYLDILTNVFMIRQIQPYHVNIRKRQIKAPKIYVRDSGILHYLLGISSMKALLTHPKVGASWEGLVIEELLQKQQYDEYFFWGTHQGAEIDLVLRNAGNLYGVECKKKDAPKMTKSIRSALEDLELRKVAVLYPGNRRYRLNDKVEVVPLKALAEGELLFPI